MTKYIKLFNSHSEYQQFSMTDLELPNVSHCIEENHVHYNPLIDDTKFILSYGGVWYDDVYFVGRESADTYVQASSLYKSVELNGNTIPFEQIDNFSGMADFHGSSIDKAVFKYELKDPTIINSNDFGNITPPQKLSIPKSVTEIQTSGITSRYGERDGISLILMYPTTPPKINQNSIMVNSNYSGYFNMIIVPKQSYEAYINDENWSAYTEYIYADATENDILEENKETYELLKKYVCDEQELKHHIVIMSNYVVTAEESSIDINQYQDVIGITNTMVFSFKQNESDYKPYDFVVELSDTYYNSGTPRTPYTNKCGMTLIGHSYGYSKRISFE